MARTKRTPRRRRDHGPVDSFIRTVDLRGRRMRVGGSRFRQLTDPDTGVYRYRHGRLIRRRFPRSFTITAIRDPSTGEIVQRNTNIDITDDDATTSAFRRIVGERGGTAYETDIIRDAVVAAGAGIIAPYLHTLQWGAYTIDIDEQGHRHRHRHGRRRVDGFLNQRLRADNPLVLPYTNVDTNEGSDDKCVERWLGYQHEDCTILGVLDAAIATETPVELFDVLGGIIESYIPPAEREAYNSGDSTPEFKRAIVYQGHVYPLKHGTSRKRKFRIPVKRIPKSHTFLDAVWRRVGLD